MFKRREKQITTGARLEPSSWFPAQQAERLVVEVLSAMFGLLKKIHPPSHLFCLLFSQPYKKEKLVCRRQAGRIYLQ